MNTCKTILVTPTEKNKALISINNTFKTYGFIGKNGITKNKIEGDNKTPEGLYKLGITFGIYNRNTIELNEKMKYIKINNNLYWVDDANSKYYNKLIDITKVHKDWKSAEHLIEYPKQYEYAIEIRTNPFNIPGKGSAIFLHCTTNEPTAGCIAIKREKMIEIFKQITPDMKIFIQKDKY